MKKLLAPIFLLFAITLASAQDEGGWSVTTSPDAVRYDDVFFINKNIGWTAGGWNSKVHKTTDGGQTWQISGPDGNTQYLRSIEFIDENIGFCGSFAGIGKPASLFRTADGGKTWTNIANKVPEVEGFCGLAKASENVIYGVGVWSEPAYVIKSTDKGLNWTFKDMSAHASSLIDAYFFDADHGFVTGSTSELVDGQMTVTGGVVLYTDDGGETWTEKFNTHHVSDRVWKIQTPDQIHFYGSIETDLGDTRMIRSDDAGQTWEMITVDNDYYYIQMIGFIDSLRGWTGGNETLFETKDGGDTWTKIPLGSTYNRFFKINEELAYMTGRKVYKFERDVITGIGDPQKYDPVHTMSISPNPTPGKANVRITFGNPTMAHVNVFSTSGSFVKRIYDGPVVAGEKVLELDLTTYPSQPYLVVVNTNEGMISAKVIRR
ncbi:MAG: hypothetical protein E6Q96_06295 [Cyclobacteriaceae bacterium]|nr:MAG: hypothetical protein E6Q96_06295 [Cyclobacteriaceae bacterium]